MVKQFLNGYTGVMTGVILGATIGAGFILYKVYIQIIEPLLSVN